MFVNIDSTLLHYVFFELHGFKRSIVAFKGLHDKQLADSEKNQQLLG